MAIHAAFMDKKRKIYIRSMIPPQYIICFMAGQEVVLEGFLNDYVNHRDVTFLWEQVKGTNTLIGPPTDDYVTSFELSDQTDKIFRLWIDKGLNEQSYKDQFIFHTPTSFYHPNNAKVKTTVNHPVTIDDISKSNTSLIAPPTRVVTPDVPSIPATDFDYTLPTDANFTPYHEKMEVYFSLAATQDPDTLFETFLPGFYPLSYVAGEGFWKFEFHYDLPDKPSLSFLSELLISKPIDTGGVKVSDDVLLLNKYERKTLDFKRFVNVRKAVGPDLIQMTFYAKNSINLLRFKNTLKGDTDPSVIYSEEMIYGKLSVSLQRADQSGIGHPL